jgi:hypothetical protein
MSNRYSGGLSNIEYPKHKQITYKMFFTNRRALIAAISATFAMVFMLFSDSILSIRLIQMGVSENDIGKF